MSRKPVGGGVKKVLYTLKTVKRIGVARSAKALNSKNACKACAYGMGGQMGGMTNELGEYPSVCNKSVQAQSTDIQPAIPAEIFAHELDELRELTPHELEHLGRLTQPVWKPAGGRRYRTLDWDEAIVRAVDGLKAADPLRSFFYASGRSSNEAGFLLQLLARAWGTNNVNNCSYYCHQATSVALASTIGTGTATVELADLDRCDLIFVIGANPASNHPRFIHKLLACRERGGDVIVINPAKEPGLVRFAVPKSPRSMLKGGSEIASDYLQPNIGEDIALFKGIAKAILESGREDRDFIGRHTEGFEAFERDLEATSWAAIESRTGVARTDIERVAARYARSKNAVFAWGMGMTHHVHGVDNVEMISNLALLCGMLGLPGRGLLPLRGHSNVQGIGTIGVKPVLPEDVFGAMEDQLGVALSREPGWDTMAAMQAAHSGGVDAALLLGGNLYAANPDSAWAEQALERIPFRISLTTTLNASHVRGVDAGEVLVLPVAARDEEWQPTTQESMFNYVRLSDGQILRHAGVRPETAILADIATGLLPDSPVDFDAFRQHREIRRVIAATIPGMEQLETIDVARREFHIGQRLMHEPVFRTPSGLASFRVCALPDSPAGDYRLTTVRSEGQFNSIVYEQRDSYRRTETRWCVMLGRDDIDALGLEAGDLVDLSSAHGSMPGVTVYEHDVPRGNALAYYPEANCLTGTDVDPRSRTPGFKHTRISIRPA